MRTIGVGYRNYATKRNIDYPQNKNELVNTYDINLALAYFGKIMPFMNNDDLKYIFNPKYSYPQKVELYHLFNGIILNANKPWFTTFETIVPRHSVLLKEHKENFPSYKKYRDNKSIKKMLPAFYSKNCKGLIAMSNCAKNIQLDFFAQMDISFDTSKLTTLLPPQPLLCEHAQKNKSKEFLEFTFIGNEFFRKGGYEMLLAIIAIKNEANFPIKLTIVSKIQEEWYGNSSPKKIEKTNELVKQNSTWITHYQNISNEKVLDILKTTDVGLLPTWSDSFGYSILEMQASGVPVITTDVRAIPEINNDDCGWIINLEKNIYGELLENEQEKISKSITDQLKSILFNIISDRSLIDQKAIKSLSRITKFHDPISHFNSLTKIYENI